MRCTHAEKLIPLFAGDDLPAREAGALRRHLESCAKCRRLAAEFEESRDWMRGFAAPQFDAATLDGMRDSVLRDIGRIENRARWIQWIVPGWNLRFAFVTSLALLLFGALFILAINHRQPLHNPESNQVKLAPGKTPDDRTNNDAQIAGSKKVQRKFRRKPIKHEPDVSPQIVAANVEPDLIYQNNDMAEPVADQSAEPDPVTTAPDPNRNMLRIEIQTADPNIRIIWFAPKSDAAPTTTPNTK
ncbi:MAG: zf-HC2 domain-containing protein [Blastocatellia bacterium]|nr:zf-HC2 domain-containing protein [Blastocatellia bacterium]